jgi:hypothetical protein
MTYWQLAQAAWQDKSALDGYLKDGWEPFAISQTDHIATVWLRRTSVREQAEAVLPAPRLRDNAAALQQQQRELERRIAELLRGL